MHICHHKGVWFVFAALSPLLPFSFTMVCFPIDIVYVLFFVFLPRLYSFFLFCFSVFPFLPPLSPSILLSLWLFMLSSNMICILLFLFLNLFERYIFLCW
uniref:Uncharacterized protein n=1 Tax=Cacopsylla melanoneura TaxID=428564 RepID=A0A8D8UWL8_9HEMI